jgi:hypothetical protein
MGVRLMANVDHTSALALQANERVVNYALDHGNPWLAQTSMHMIQYLDGLGSFIIACVLALLQGMD